MIFSKENKDKYPISINESKPEFFHISLLKPTKGSFNTLSYDCPLKQDQKGYVHPILKDLFHIQSGRSILIKDSYYTNALADEQKILVQVQNIQYDIIVDLNSYFHLGIARLISLLKANVKMGFKSSFSEKFYNIQLDISKTGVMEKGYKQINTILAS